LSNFYMNHGKYFAGNNGSFSNSYNFNKWNIKMSENEIYI
jgi:hypothetical protein